MKTTKFITLAITVFVCFSCTDEYIDLGSGKQLSQEKNSRNYSEALRVAQKSISLLTPIMTRSGSSSREIDLSKTRAITHSVTRNGSVENDTLIYVFNFKDNNGFALVSASSATEELLAVTEKGNYDPDQPLEIEGFNRYIEQAVNYVSTASSDGLRKPHPNENDEFKDSVVITYVPTPIQHEPPYIPINWGQDTPEGDFCSNHIAGCVNTAIGEIMMFFSYPTSIQLTYPNADKSTEVLNWYNINNHIPGHEFSFCNDYITHNSIARLVRQIGYLTDSNYSYIETSTSKDEIKPVLQALGFTVYNWANYNRLTVKTELSNGHLFMVSGRNYLKGHAWVLDHMIEKITTTYQLQLTANGWVPTGVVHTNTSNLLHYNWGEYGLCNGYFSEGVYNMSQAEISDNLGNLINGPTYSTDTQFLCVYH